MYADIIIAKGQIDRPITYKVPDRLLSEIRVGMEVKAPLANQIASGYVLSLADACALENVKELIDIVNSEQLFTFEQSEVIKFLVNHYLSTYLDAIKLCVVDNKKFAAESFIANEKHFFLDKKLESVQQYIFSHGAPVKFAKLSTTFGTGISETLAELARQKTITPIYGKSLNKYINLLVIADGIDLEQTISALPKNATAQIELLRFIEENKDVFPLTVRALADAAKTNETTVRAVSKKGILNTVQADVRRNPWENINLKNISPPPLTALQQSAVERIKAAYEKGENEKFLLYGVTGSGKTEVFLHAVDEVIKNGKQAIVLVPEISLTAQAMALFYGRFGDRVAILHSNLSSGERYDEWQRIKTGQATVVLGARSAIFAPVESLGLIIIDEEHEGSYKQENSPRYNAKQVGEFLSDFHSCPLVLASATPSLESMARAKNEEYSLITLPKRIENRPMPEVKIIDLKRMTKNGRILSFPLKDAIAERLEKGEQCIIFLNRRGFSHSLLCVSCGNFASCPHCNVPLTYHKAKNILQCNHCDYAIKASAKCSACGGENIAYKGVGTERLEAEISAEFPTARVARLDRDTTQKKGAHSDIFNRFSNCEIDILIGTQMVAKGFDFPRVTLVGVIAADTMLGISDFRAPERTFQLLTQVAGRAGRADLKGEVFVQTFQPEHYAIECASKHDYDTFFAQELANRVEVGWPPKNRLANVVISGENENLVMLHANHLRKLFNMDEKKSIVKSIETKKSSKLSLFEDLLGFKEEIEGEKKNEEEEKRSGFDFSNLYISDAVPCNLAKLKGKYRYHIIFRGEIEIILRALNIIKKEKKEKDIFVAIDVDPTNIL